MRAAIRSTAVLLCLTVASAAVTYFAIAHRTPVTRNTVTESARHPVSRRVSVQSSPDTRPPEQSSKVDDLQRTIASLDAEVTALRNALRVAEQRAPMQVESPVSTNEPVAIDEDDTHSRPGDGAARAFAQLERRFAAQPIDTSWSAAMTTRLQAMLGKPPLDRSGVENIECRSSLCRVALGTTDRGALEALEDGLRTGVADVLGATASQQDASDRFVVYLAHDPRALDVSADP